MGNRVSNSVFWVYNYLDNPMGIPQIDEDKAPVVAATVDPSREHNRPTLIRKG
tara:strand:- start:16747 stop:16905 length:159 start_codon:yes stop_codon:yes gene_type:complete